MRVLFLDFDGPLHPVSAISGLTPGLVTIVDAKNQRGLFRWAPQLVELLRHHEDVGIVVHSAWRAFASNSELREVLGELGDRLLGVTPVEMQRYEGIVATVGRFGIEQYVIVDDAIERFPDGIPELLVADPELGLSEGVLQERIANWLQATAEDPHTPSAPPSRP